MEAEAEYKRVGGIATMAKVSQQCVSLQAALALSDVRPEGGFCAGGARRSGTRTISLQGRESIVFIIKS